MRSPRILGLLLGSVGLAAALFLFVLPGRTYLEQRHSLIAANARVRILAAEDARLTLQAQRLHGDAEIERLARQQYGLVKPGEKAYAILPPSPPQPSRDATRLPPSRSQPKASRLSRLWSRVQFWN